MTGSNPQPGYNYYQNYPTNNNNNNSGGNNSNSTADQPPPITSTSTISSYPQTTLGPPTGLPYHYQLSTAVTSNIHASPVTSLPSLSSNPKSSLESLISSSSNPQQQQQHQQYTQPLPPPPQQQQHQQQHQQQAQQSQQSHAQQIPLHIPQPVSQSPLTFSYPPIGTAPITANPSGQVPRSSLASILSSDSTYPKSSYQPSTRSPQRSNSRRRSVIPTTSSSTSTPRSQQQQQYHHHHHHPSQSQSYWDKDDLDTLKELLEIGERAKWKFISTELTRERNKRITAVASQKKFKDMFGVAEASSALGSSLCYVVPPNGWSCLDQSKPLSTSAMQSTYEDTP